MHPWPFDVPSACVWRVFHCDTWYCSVTYRNTVASLMRDLTRGETLQWKFSYPQEQNWILYEQLFSTHTQKRAKKMRLKFSNGSQFLNCADVNSQIVQICAKANVHFLLKHSSDVDNIVHRKDISRGETFNEIPGSGCGKGLVCQFVGALSPVNKKRVIHICI